MQPFSAVQTASVADAASMIVAGNEPSKADNRTVRRANSAGLLALLNLTSLVHPAKTLASSARLSLHGRSFRRTSFEARPEL